MKKLLPLIIVIILIGIVYFLGNMPENSTKKIVGNAPTPCLIAGGQWSEEFKECLGIDATTCKNIGGKFNECASACRNTKQEICTMQCVQVCEIK